ncbi:endonuclease domain-containing protein [Priestia koreensis]|uniref:endonuclease domain-containing protein n=1 Tax=Priestia koreensis TaxID=284581 RepID=UPI003D0377E8
MVDYAVFFGMLLLVLGLFIYYLIHEKEMKVEASPYVREQMKCESPIERKLFHNLYLRNHQITTQYPVGKYRLDMAIPHLKIAIECDGKAYHTSPDQRAHDKKRDRYLRSRGWKVLRFSGSKIHRDVMSCINKIEEEIIKSTPI